MSDEKVEMIELDILSEDVAYAFGLTPWLAAQMHFCEAWMLDQMGRKYRPCGHAGCRYAHGHPTDRVVRRLVLATFIRRTCRAYAEHDSRSLSNRP